MATGDLNGDDFVDVVTANLASSVSVFLNSGDGTGTLSPATTYSLADGSSTADGSASPVLADFNGDGNIDIATANLYGDSVSILLGRGDGTFAPAVTYPAPTPSHMVAGDFNGDGVIDLAMLVGQGGGDTNTKSIALLLGAGDGSFKAPTTFKLTIPASSLAAGDFNGDGLVDLATSTASNYDTASVLINRGDGTFRGAQRNHVGPAPFAIASGDFNGDGLTDLVTANSWDGTFSVLLNKGNPSGTFGKSGTISGVGGPMNISTADMNGDGYADIIAGNPWGNEIYVVLSNGDGTFATPTICNTTRGPLFLTAADLNNDGKLDLVASNSTAPAIAVLLTP